MNPDPAHCIECRALYNLRAHLRALHLDTTVDADRLWSLLNWWDLIGTDEVPFSAFVGYAQAIGCTVNLGFDRPLLTVELLGTTKQSEPDTRHRITRLVGSYEDTGAKAFQKMFHTQKGETP